MHFHVPLHRRQRHSEGPDDVALPHRSIGDQLAGNHPEALHIFLVMLKYWQQAVEIDYLSVLLLERQVLGDGGQAVRKDRQLELRHWPSFPDRAGPRKPANGCQSRSGHIPRQTKNHGVTSGVRRLVSVRLWWAEAHGSRRVSTRQTR